MENFDLIVPDDDTNRRAKRATRIANKIRSKITDGRKKNAMDYGCGTGRVGIQLADIFESLLLVDSSPSKISQVEQKLKILNNPALTAVCCDLMTSDTLLKRFHYIFASLVLHHIIDTDAILSKFYASLHIGGHLLVVDFDKEDGSFHAKYPDFDGHNGFEQPALIHMAENVGFRNVKTETFYYDRKIVNQQEKPYSLFIMDAEK